MVIKFNRISDKESGIFYKNYGSFSLVHPSSGALSKPYSDKLDELLSLTRWLDNLTYLNLLPMGSFNQITCLKVEKEVLAGSGAIGGI